MYETLQDVLGVNSHNDQPDEYGIAVEEWNLGIPRENSIVRFVIHPYHFIAVVISF
jgi:hypothetical protein